MSKKNPSRAERFSQAQQQVSDAGYTIQELTEELQNWLDNLPENLQSSNKASMLEDAISNLEECKGYLEDAENVSVDFPGMFS